METIRDKGQNSAHLSFKQPPDYLPVAKGIIFCALFASLICVKALWFVISPFPTVTLEAVPVFLHTAH